MSPYFSVVIPLYNRRDLIARTIASVQQQTFQDFEVVVVDDGSRDRPEEVIDALGDPRVRLLRQENRGGCAARNAGIDAARGRYVAFLDSDDSFLPHHLAQAHTFLEREPDVSLVFSDIVLGTGMSGFELGHWVRTNRPDVKVLLTTGYASDAESEKPPAQKYEILHKPYARSDLAEALRAALAAG